MRHNTKHPFVSLRAALRIVLLLPFLLSAAPFKIADHPRTFIFPRDHGRHDGFKIEWWYFTGNLDTPAGRRLGYQLTFFRSALSPAATSRPSRWGTNDLYFAHAAVTDVDGKTFVYKDRLDRGRPGLAQASDEKLDVSLLDWSAVQLADGTIHLKAAEPALAIDLSLTPTRAPVPQGPGGVNLKGTAPGRASNYYSMTRLKTAGTVTTGGKTTSVTGNSWMDHEFSSNSLSPSQTGWDWMGLQLNDGQDLMLYRIRSTAGRDDYLSGTLTTPDGTPHYLTAGDIRLSHTDNWTSPASGGVYPQTWSLTVKGLPPLRLHSDLPGQELVTTQSTEVTYFEGSATVNDTDGKIVGRGYLEMTGYTGTLQR